jgi:uroporphyrinogen-III synthase
MANVILLRTPLHDSADPYEQIFESSGYHASSVSVLETKFTNLAELERWLRSSPEAKGYTGVIATSARACEAWKAVVMDLLADKSNHIQEALLCS